MSKTFNRFKMLFAGLSLLACSSVFAAPLVVDVAGIQSFGEFGDADNTVLTFDVGANSTITSVSYSFGLTAYDPSYLSEMVVGFTDSNLFGVFFTPGLFEGFPGSAIYEGSVDLVEIGLSFNVGADGILRLEFFEDWDDFLGADGQWDFGTITFGIEPVAGEVPEPGSILLIGAGLAAMGYTGRRRAARKAGALAA